MVIIMERTYVCIDLKSFYASVECRERGLDPITTNLVVADNGRTEKTICLAVSPALKSFGIPGRARLFEVVQKVKNVNYERRRNNYNRKFIGKSYNIEELKKNISLELDFIIATPPCNFWSRANWRRYSSAYALSTRHLLPGILHRLINLGKHFIISNIFNNKRFT